MSHPIAITSGDPNGIGPEITLKAHQEINASNGFIIADQTHLKQTATALGIDIEIIPIKSPTQIAQIRPSNPTALFVIHQEAPPQKLGIADKAQASSILASIETALSLTKTGEAGAMVTNPINKWVLKNGTMFDFPGHTEFLAAQTQIPLPIMMLAAEDFRVIPTTIHIALSEVSKKLTPQLLTETIKIVARDLNSKFGITNPKIAVSGLNPHAGEDGLMGDEEIDWIKDCLDQLRATGLSIIGPLAADTLFTAAIRQTYDVAIAMYHDQALIPIKTLYFDQAVNITLGLPIIRTSPDHGTAYDIAPKYNARPQSLIAAVKLARQMADHTRAAP